MATIDEATGGFRHFRIALSPDGKPYRHDPSEKLPEGFTLAAENDPRFYSEGGIMLARYMSVARICDYKREKRDFMGWTDEQRKLYVSPVPDSIKEMLKTPTAQKRFIGYAPRLFIDLGDGLWRAPEDAIIGNYYVIDNLLFCVTEIIAIVQDEITKENVVEQFAHSIVKMRVAKQGTPEEIKMYLVVASMPDNIPMQF